MATRMAFNIGLNIDCTNLVESGVISKEAANIRQVVWSGCWILDKYSCEFPLYLFQAIDRFADSLSSDWGALGQLLITM